MSAGTRAPGHVVRCKSTLIFTSTVSAQTSVCRKGGRRSDIVCRCLQARRSSGGLLQCDHNPDRGRRTEVYQKCIAESLAEWTIDA